MEPGESGLTNFYTAFPPNSVNVLASSTNSGKTTLALNVIENHLLYCENPFSKVLVILCNPKIYDGSVYLDNKPEGLDIEVTSLEDFDSEIQLTEHCFLIFEDVLHLDNKIIEAVNLRAHHSNLESVFIICQGLLGNKDLFRLCSIAHRVVLFFNSQAAVRLCRFLKSSFFQDPELKDYLSRIISHAERNKEVLLLELNQINGQSKPKFLAISGVDKIGEQKPAVYFPHMNESRDYHDNFDDNVAEMEIDHDLPPGSYVLVPAANVRKKSKDVTEADADLPDCERDWKILNEEISDNLEASVKANKLHIARNIVRFILRCKRICVSKDGQVMYIVGEPKTKINLMDFVLVAIRQSGPREEIDSKYLPFMKVLLTNGGAHESLFKNKTLLHAAVHGKKKAIKGKFMFHQDQYPTRSHHGERGRQKASFNKKRAPGRRISEYFYD